MKTCKSCGKQLDAAAVFCENCGARICRNCGALLEEGAAFCEECGTKIEAAGAPAKAKPDDSASAVETAPVPHAAAVQQAPSPQASAVQQLPPAQPKLSEISTPAKREPRAGVYILMLILTFPWIWDALSYEIFGWLSINLYLIAVYIVPVAALVVLWLKVRWKPWIKAVITALFLVALLSV